MILSTPPGIDAPFSSGNGFSIGDLNKDQTYNVTFPVNLTKKTNFRNIHAILAAGNNGSVVQDEIFFEFPEDMSNFSAKDPISLEPSGNISAPDLVSPGSDGFNPAAEQFLIVYRFSFLARDNQIKPVRNAVVEVIDAGSGLPVLQSSTDQDGKCSISLDNSGGEIYLRIQASSPAARITDPDGSTWRWKTENITVNPGSGGYTGDGSIVEDPEPFQILLRHRRPRIARWACTARVWSRLDPAWHA